MTVKPATLGTLAVALTVGLCQPAMASDDMCPLWGEAAEIVALSHQTGEPVSKHMANLDMFSDYERPIARRMFLAAYDEPRYETPEYMLRNIADFRNRVETQCYAEGW